MIGTTAQTSGAVEGFAANPGLKAWPRRSKVYPETLIRTPFDRSFWSTPHSHFSKVDLLDLLKNAFASWHPFFGTNVFVASSHWVHTSVNVDFNVAPPLLASLCTAVHSSLSVSLMGRGEKPTPTLPFGMPVVVVAFGLLALLTLLPVVGANRYTPTTSAAVCGENGLTAWPYWNTATLLMLVLLLVLMLLLLLLLLSPTSPPRRTVGIVTVEAGARSRGSSAPMGVDRKERPMLLFTVSDEYVRSTIVSTCRSTV